jgi:GPH family glycoside/pentoside/hexuronide:cation symporter
MSEPLAGARDKIPLPQKLAFGSGHLVNNLLPGSLGVFSFFLLTAFGMDPFLAGLLGGLPRAYDALTDPIMGYISDNTVSRWGRRRPYIFVGAISSGVLFAALWQLDASNGQTFNFWYFLIMSLVYLTANTIFATPLIGLGYEMSSDYNERTRLMGFSQTLGQVAWMIVPWFWVLIADKDVFASQAEGVRGLSLAVGAACAALGVLPALFCREMDQANLASRTELSLRNIVGNMKELFANVVKISKNVPFVRLCAATFLVFNGFQMVASFSFFIIVFYLFKGDYGAAGTWPAWFSTASAFATAFMVIPIVTQMSTRLGKRNAFIGSTALSIAGYILKWWGFDPANPWLIFLPVPLIAFGLGGLFTLMMSMTADVCDLDELENGLPRKEGTFGAIYWWMVKLGQAGALVVGGLVLKLSGFESTATVQTADTIRNLRLADIIIPAGTAAMAIMVMWRYDLSESKARQMKDELVRRRGDR